MPPTVMVVPAAGLKYPPAVPSVTPRFAFRVNVPVYAIVPPLKTMLFAVIAVGTPPKLPAPEVPSPPILTTPPALMVVALA